MRIPYIKTKAKVTNLKWVTISTINNVLKSCGISVLQNDPENQDLPIKDNGDLPIGSRGMKCHVCMKDVWKMKKDVDEKAT